MKQETLEEAAKKHINSENKYNRILSGHSFVEGAKWQQQQYVDFSNPNADKITTASTNSVKIQAKRMYSEEDMKNCFHAGEMHCATEGKVYERSANFEVWFEQFKNK